jgi:peptidoglycan/xylan/chitin deacetylase (PgdA/CDA1 family)
MKKKFWPWPLLLLFLFCSCRTIDHHRTALNIPPSIVLFSFDDGPNAKGDTTPRLLDLLKKYQIKAIFCLLGENVERYPDLVRRIYDEGHWIINHGYSEKWASGMTPDEFRNNLVRGREAISAALGHDMYPKLYRPHGGFYNAAQEKIMRDEGYTLVFSNVRVYDAVLDGTKQDKVVKKVVRKIKKQSGGIILVHDARDSHSRMETQLVKNPHGVFDRSWIPETVEKIIQTLLDGGFILKGLDFPTTANY